MSVRARLLNGAWLGAQRLGHARFESALRAPRRHQEALLRRYLTVNARTQFGTRHGFASMRSVNDYRDRVPLSTYDDYAEAIARVRAGAQSVLTAERVVLLEPSSGSTRAVKLIPYTRTLQAEIRRAIAPWVVDLARQVPAIRGGVSYWSITPALPSIAAPASAVPIGFDADSSYLGGWLAWLTRHALLPCDDLRHVRDHAEFRRLTLLRLLSAADLRLISVWHPTFLTLLLDELAASWPQLLRDLERGVAPAGPVHGLRSDRARARALAAADPSAPQTLWPELAVISCWGDGHAAAPLAALAQRFPQVHIQPKGLLATEACISLPFAGLHPLAVRSHFFEFIDSSGAARCAWELACDETYAVVVTTGGGLYRYQLQDRIVVEAMLEHTPCVRFVGKQDCVSDLRGEKLNEAFVAEILGRLLPALAPRAAFAMLAPNVDAAPPHYTLFVDAPAAPDDRLQARLEKELERNPHYVHCVRLGQLAPVEIVRAGAGAAQRYLERLTAAGRRLGSIKPAALSPMTGWAEVLAAGARTGGGSTGGAEASAARTGAGSGG